MGAGSTKGVRHTDNVDRVSVSSEDYSPPQVMKAKKPANSENDKSNIRKRIEMVSDESDIDDDAPKSPSKSTTTNDSRQPEDKKRNLFGFSRKKEEKTNAFIHNTDEGEVSNKKTTINNNKTFGFFNSKKENKTEAKDEKSLDQDLTELQTTFDSLGIVDTKSKHSTKDNKIAEKSVPEESSKRNQTSQSADDLLELEPMRNRMNQRRRFSRPSNSLIPTSTPFGVPRRSSEGGALTGNLNPRRNFKYSWEKENAPLPVTKNEEWDYESVSIIIGTKFLTL